MESFHFSQDMKLLVLIFEPALDYIHERYLDPIELDELARHALMNKSYLCTSFIGYSN